MRIKLQEARAVEFKWTVRKLDDCRKRESRPACPICSPLAFLKIPTV
jgi:hypothetical protein